MKPRLAKDTRLCKAAVPTERLEDISDMTISEREREKNLVRQLVIDIRSPRTLLCKAAQTENGEGYST